MSCFWERLEKVLPELLGEDIRKAREIRRGILGMLVEAGRCLLRGEQPERWRYISDSDDEEDEKSISAFLAAWGDPPAEFLRAFENLTEYETEYWLRYQGRIREEWTILIKSLQNDGDKAE